ncbi:MAG TPA: NAD(P)-dependent oxidoreductase [Burkholderiales bacterium]|nr:NAD(P)-dependent oxidoreductase [Burkholderiales bacterium]
MSDVLCLRPQADFQRAGVAPPASLTVNYRVSDDPQLAGYVRSALALVIPAVGPKLAGTLFEGGSVKLVQVTGAGVDRVDEAAMKRLGIAVANVPGGSNSAVAEYVLASALVLLRRLAWADAEIRNANYVSFRGRMIADNLPGLEGLTVGVVGLGTVGFAVAEAFHRFGCRIVYHDPAPRNAQAAAKIGAQAVPLEELLRTADVITLHVPLLPQTRSLIGMRQFSVMKPGAVLIQASRGGVVNEEALVTHLNSGRLGGAAIDVYATEPPDPDNPLFALEGDAARRILFTPHIAGVTRQASATLFREAWANVERVLVKGEAPLNRVY